MQLSFLYDIQDNLKYILITDKKYIDKYFPNFYRSEHTALEFISLLRIMETTHFVDANTKSPRLWTLS